MIEARHHRGSNLIGRDQGSDVFSAVIGWYRALVPQRLGVCQAEALMDLDHCVHGSRRQEAALDGLLLELVFLLRITRVCWALETRLGHDVCKVLIKYKQRSLKIFGPTLSVPSLHQTS